MSDVLTAPTLSQVQWIGTTTIQANFTFSSGSTFQIGLFQDGGDTPTQTAPSGPGMAMLSNPQVNTTSVWTIKIAETSGSTVGPYSNALPVIVGVPQNIVVQNNGQALALSWAPPAGATVATGASILLLNATTGVILDNTTVDGTSALYAPPGGLNSAIVYSVKIAADLNTSFGPYSAAVSVIQTTPQFSSFNYNLAGNAASVSANAETVGTNLLGLYIYAGGVLVASGIATTVGTFIQFSLQSALDPAYLYDAYLAYTVTGGSTRGPLSAPQNVLTMPVTISAVSYDGTSITASWNNGVGTPPPTGAYVQVVNSAGGTAAFAEPFGNSVTWVPSTPLTANTPYSMKINPTRSRSMGPVSSEVDVLTFVESLIAVSYDGANITASWTKAGSPDVERTIVALLNSGSVVQTQLGGDVATTIAAALSPSGTYDLALQTAGENTLGPLGTTTPIISAVARVTGAAYTIGSGTSSIAVTWSTSGAHGVAGYTLQLYENGAPLGSAVTVSGSGASSGTISIASVLDPSKTHSVTVQAYGTNTTGALSVAGPVITAAPVIVALEYDNGTVTASWLPVTQDGVSGYQVIVGGTTKTTSATSISFAYSASGPSPSFSVQAIGASASGPAVAETMLTETVAVTSVTYDGAVLTVAWSTGSPSPEYVVQVIEGGSVIASRPSTGASASLAIVLSAAATYGVDVRAAGPGVLGPSGTAFGVISAMPAIGPVVTTSSAACNVALTAPAITSGISGYQVALFIGEQLVGSWIDASSMSAWVPLPSPLVPSGYSVRARAIGTNLTGPTTSAVPIVVAAPEILSLAFDGANAALSWSAVEGASGYEVIASASPATPHYASGTSLTFPIHATGDTLSISAIDGVASGPPSSSLGVVTETIALSSASYDGAFLSASWSAATTPLASYIVELLNGDVAEATFATSATSGLFAASLSPSGTYSLRIRVIAGNSVGAPGASMAVISASPSIVAADASATAIVVTLAAPPVASGINGYEAALFAGSELIGSWVTATGMSATLTIASPTMPWQYSVRARAKNGSNSGPSIAIDAITVVPQNVEATYDGTNVLVAWDAVAAPSLAGYRVTLFSGANSLTSFDTTATSMSFAYALALATNDYGVVVQAISDVASGPQSESVNPVADSVGYFFPPGLVSPSAPADYAYLFRGDIREPGPSSTITLYLPDIFAAPLANAIHAAPFTIEATPVGTAMPYQLVAGGGSPPDLWTFDTNGIRPDVAAAVDALYTQVAALAAPGGLPVLQQVIAQGLPLNFVETLYYSYGLNGDAGYVNLQAGMRLRIDYENYQFVSTSSADKLNGYSGSGTSLYDIVALPTNGGFLPLAFDAFLSQLAVPQVTANSGGDGGIIDLQGSAYALPYFRLFYPPRFPSSDSAGVIGTSQNAVIVGAATYGALQAATTQYLQFTNFNGVSGIVWTYFRGRATLIPEIQVFVNDVPVWVSVGTTVGQLLQRTSALPYDETTSATHFLYLRAIGNVVDATSEVLPQYPIARSNVVHFGYATIGQYTGGLDPFDLPVLAGDSLTFES